LTFHNPTTGERRKHAIAARYSLRLSLQDSLYCIFPGISSTLPAHDEIVVDKDRFCAFSGNDLKEVLRSGGIKHLVMAGVVTSGVILSTFYAGGG
jgi:hypothetical protein